MRCLIALLVLTTAACAAPRNVTYRVGTGTGFVNGISEATLYPGYWTGMSGPIIHDAGTNNVPATDLDPLQTRLTWMEDTVTNAAYWEAAVTNLQSEWSSSANKYGGAITYTYYVDWANGDDSTGDGSTGNPWKTIEYAAEYVQVNRLDGSNNLDATTLIALKPGIHYIGSNADHTGTGAPAGGRCTVRFDNFIGSSGARLLIRGTTGDRSDVIVRIDHAHEAAFETGYNDGTYVAEFGIKVSGTSDYIEFADFTLVGPMFELAYSDGGGDCVGIHVEAYSGAGHISAVNVEATQWSHCGFKAENMQVYGCYLHNNGASSGNYYGATSGAAVSGHDHNLYLTGDATISVLEANVFIDGFTNGINPRAYSDSGTIIRGNIIGWNGGAGGNIGGFGTIVENNVFINNGVVGILWGDDNAGMLVRNNVFYETDIDTIGLGGAYTRPIGFVWTTNGILTGKTFSSIPSYTAWTTSTTVPRPASLYYGANNYYNQVSASAATGATPPTHTSGSVSDGTITWRYVGDAGVESFGTTTTIDSADFNDFAARDFRPASGSDLLSNGTDYGQGTTIGAFNAAP